MNIPSWYLKKFLSNYTETTPLVCWTWLGAKDKDGYGRMFIGRTEIAAHRVAWLVHRGSLEGKCVLHSCDNPSCVNPHHLFLGTDMDNHIDMITKGRQAKGEKNGQAKLTEDNVREIRKLAASGQSNTSLARKFGVSEKAVRLIVKRVNWKYLD